jgi:hypothetical protein
MSLIKKQREYMQVFSFYLSILYCKFEDFGLFNFQLQLAQV